MADREILAAARAITTLNRIPLRTFPRLVEQLELGAASAVLNREHFAQAQP